jgi:ABC-type nitrate/sulfonate/bicarbonate transport system substrate-binding protein
MDVKDVPWLMALDVLREMGYTVELTAFAKSSLIPPALLHGDIDVGSANTTLVWAAIEKGADIRTVAGRANVGFYLVATQEIRDCRDLDKKVITFSTRQSIGYVMFEKYLNRHCPGVTPEVLMIDGSENRVVALQVREVVAAYVEIEEWYQLQQAAPGEFHVLIDFGREFPQVQMLTFTVRREWADENSEMLNDFIRALLEAKRHVIEYPQFLQDMIAKYQSLDADKAKDLAEVYLEAVIWDPNGGITQENIQYTLDFLIQGEILSSGLGVEEVADLSYLNAVLDDIGRQR